MPSIRQFSRKEICLYSHKDQECLPADIPGLLILPCQFPGLFVTTQRSAFPYAPLNADTTRSGGDNAETASVPAPPSYRPGRTAFAAAQQASGERQEPFGLTCNTDMNHFVRAGIPTVIIGPGTITVAHKPNESVELEQLEKTCTVDEAVIRALLR